MSTRDRTVEDILGPAACEVADAIAAAAPPLTAQQRENLAALFRRTRPEPVPERTVA